MGYTHYWYPKKSFTKKQWSGILEDSRTILNFFKIPVEDVQLTLDKVRFNGEGEDSHETFVINRKKVSDFDFCKTARKPYDLLVCLVLARINHHAPGVLEISSDGDWDEEWVPIWATYKSLFETELENFLKTE